MKLDQLFTQRARETPHKVAIKSASGSITYGQLEKRANQLASYLQSIKEIPSNSLIPICMKRGIETLVGIMGVLKVGSAYVPIDQDEPFERLKKILNEVEAEVVLTTAEVALPDEFHDRVVCLEESFFKSGGNSSVNSKDKNLNDLAYIIYTSGSTGQPKGVRITQENVLNYISWFRDEFNVNTNSIFDFSSLLSVDLSVTCSLLPLVCGASVVICDHSLKTRPQEFLAYLKDNNITHLKVTPSYFKLLVDYPLFIKKLQNLRWVILGGEAVFKKDLVKWLSANQFQSIVNEYGPTETTVAVSSYEVTSKNIAECGECIPIGKSIPNVKTYILNEQEEICSQGDCGELCIAGKSVAAGYIGEANVPDRRFTNNKFDFGAYKTLYRTGDIVKQLSDGNYIFVGRKDRQIKVRGFRVELDEIDNCLKKHPLVDNCHVVFCNNGVGNKIIVAFLVYKDKSLFDLSEIRQYLNCLLPEHMIPSRYILLDVLPLGGNGKINAKKLENYFKDSVLVRSTPCVKPENQIEKKLLAIIASGLKIPESLLSVEDNFFVLGGDSLLAIEITNKINLVFDVQCDVGFIYDNLTVRSMTKFIRSFISIGLERSCLQNVLDCLGDHQVSCSQKLILNHQMLMPDAPFYNEHLVISIYEEVNVDILKASINVILNRHRIFSANFFERSWSICQRITEKYLSNLEIIDIKGEKEKDKIIKNIVTPFLRMRFDLKKDLLIRFLLVKVSDKFYKLFVCAHHSIVDAVTMFNVFFPKLKNIYETLIVGGELPREEIRYNYPLFVSEEERYLLTKNADKDRDYWRQQLGDVDWDMNSQLLGSGGRLSSASGSVKYFCLPYALLENLKNFSKKNGVTFFVTLFSIFSVLIHKYTANNDIVIATTTAGRMKQRYAKEAGNFLNILLLRTTILQEMSFENFLANLNHVVIGALKHQSLPFLEVTRLLGISKKIGLSTPFQVAFILEPNHMASDGGWVSSQAEVHSGYSKFPLTFELDEHDFGLFGRVEYQKQFIDDYVVDAMIKNYELFLKHLISVPNKKLHDMLFLYGGEQEIFFETWSKGQKRNYSDSVQSLFERITSLYPYKIAVSCYDKHMTFSQLNAISNKIARFLRQKRLQKEAIIPVYMQRDVGIVAAVLGILKAGYAFTLLDEKLPSSRIKYILDDVNAKMIFTHSKLLPTLNGIKFEGIERVLLDDYKFLDAYLDADLEFAINPNQLAYVVYTSGSTGAPKGALIEHKNLLNTIINQIDFFGIKKDSKVLSLTYIGFDAFISELFFSLLAGASFYLVSYDNFPSPRVLRGIVQSTEATVLTLTPSVLSLLTPNDLLGIKTLITAGEACPQRLVDRWSKRLRFINAYGPSECAICATAELFMGDDEAVNIGIPLPNVKVYVLDHNLKPVMPGRIGELYIGGVGVGRGYLNLPEFTKLAFIPDLFSADSEARMYKTGDLVKWLPNGKLAYVGRADEQVKIRGCRVELGEVESNLLKHDFVAQCKVVEKRDKDGIAFLEGYLVLRGEATLGLEEIKDFMAKLVPDYMVPTKFFLLEKMPLSDNGKVDKKLLKGEPLLSVSQSSRDDSILLEPVQEELRKMWVDLLDVENIFLDDDFFALGGHSLAVIKLISRIEDIFSVKIEPHSFCLTSTINKLSELVVDGKA